jgi:hypothetical protein
MFSPTSSLTLGEIIIQHQIHGVVIIMSKTHGEASQTNGEITIINPILGVITITSLTLGEITTLSQITNLIHGEQEINQIRVTAGGQRIKAIHGEQTTQEVRLIH